MPNIWEQKETHFTLNVQFLFDILVCQLNRLMFFILLFYERIYLPFPFPQEERKLRLINIKKEVRIRTRRINN